MNKQRRKQLEDIQNNLQNIMSELEILKDEEQEYFDNMPDSLQYGEKGDKAQEAVDAIEGAINGIDEVLESINNAIN